MTRITSAILLLALCSVGARAGERLITLGGDVTEIVFALGRATRSSPGTAPAPSLPPPPHCLTSATCASSTQRVSSP